jgi:hypothetical protein
VNGETVTITVDVEIIGSPTYRDSTGKTFDHTQGWANVTQKAWNDAAKGRRYNPKGRCLPGTERVPGDGYKLEFRVRTRSLPAGSPGTPGHHHITFSPDASLRSHVLVPGGSGDAAYTTDLTGTWGPIEPFGAVHEMTHLMGLPDDYDHNTEKAFKNRRGTLMATYGAMKIDQDLVNRVGQVASHQAAAENQALTARCRAKKNVRVAVMEVNLSGSSSADYGKDPGPLGQGHFGTYSSSWNWHQTRTSIYRRRDAKHPFGFYTTVVESQISVTEQSNIGFRDYMGPASSAAHCDPGPHAQRKTDTDRTGSPVAPPRRNQSLIVVVGIDVSSACNGVDHDFSSDHTHDIQHPICVFSCTLPPGKLTATKSYDSRNESTDPDKMHRGISRHFNTASYSVKVVFSGPH